jgi:hypothetical protein
MAAYVYRMTHSSAGIYHSLSHELHVIHTALKEYLVQSGAHPHEHQHGGPLAAALRGSWRVLSSRLRRAFPKDSSYCSELPHITPRLRYLLTSISMHDPTSSSSTHSLRMESQTLAVLDELRQYCNGISCSVAHDIADHYPAPRELVGPFPSSSAPTPEQFHQHRLIIPTHRAALKIINDIGGSPSRNGHNFGERLILQYVVDSELDVFLHQTLNGMFTSTAAVDAGLIGHPYAHLVTRLASHALLFDNWCDDDEALMTLLTRHAGLVDPQLGLYQLQARIMAHRPTSASAARAVAPSRGATMNNLHSGDRPISATIAASLSGTSTALALASIDRIWRRASCLGPIVTSSLFEPLADALKVDMDPCVAWSGDACLLGSVVPAMTYLSLIKRYLVHAPTMDRAARAFGNECVHLLVFLHSWQHIIDGLYIDGGRVDMDWSALTPPTAAAVVKTTYDSSSSTTTTKPVKVAPPAKSTVRASASLGAADVGKTREWMRLVAVIAAAALRNKSVTIRVCSPCLPHLVLFCHRA